MKHTDLWAKVHSDFDTDDGSLPGIEISGLTGDLIVKIYEMFHKKSVILKQSANAAALVVFGEAEPFQCLSKGLVIDDEELPALGLFICKDAIEIDYRMGPEWTPKKVEAFFKLLKDIVTMAPDARVQSAKVEGLINPKNFLGALEEFIRS